MATKEKLDSLSSNNLLLVMMLISLLIIGVTVLAGKAMVTGIVRDTKVLGVLNTSEKNLKDNLVAAPLLVSEHAAMGPTARKLADALPVTADLPSLIVALENMNGESTLSVKSVSPSLSANSAATKTSSKTTSSNYAPKPQPYVVSVSYEGTFGALARFLTDVETYSRPMRVTNIRMSGAGSSMSGTMEIETFFQDKAKLPFEKETIK